MVYGGAPWFESSDALPKARTGEAKARIWSGFDWISERCKRATSTIASPEVMVRTAWYKDLGGYRDDLPHTADLEMWLRIAAHSDVAFLRGVDQAFYRAHRQSMSRTTFGSQVDDLRQRKLCFDVLFQSSRLSPQDVSRLKQSTDRALAREALWRACRLLDKGEVDSERVQKLEQFACRVYPGAGQLPESRLLRNRRRIGPRLCPLVQYVQPNLYVHRLQRTVARRRSYTTGV
jgi:hypothetical protein